MEAKIKITGNGATGYHVEIVLPKAWIKQFKSDSRIFVGKRPLWELWSDYNVTETTCSDWESFKTLTEANGFANEVREQIQRAQLVLSNPQPTNEEIAIPLD